MTALWAPDILVAIHEAGVSPEHTSRSITSVEERVPVEALHFSDEDIIKALLQSSDGSGKFDPKDMPEGSPFYKRDRFDNIVHLAAKLLAMSFIPGLHISFMDSKNKDHYAVVEVRDDTTGTYLVTKVAKHELTKDHDATGCNGLLSIARALIDIAEPLI